MSHRWGAILAVGDPVRYYARCRCGHKTPDRLMRHHVGDDMLKHDNAIERLRLQLGTRTPSLKDQRDYYEQQAENPDLPLPERALWRQLADELTGRLGDRGDHGGEQLALL